MLNDAHLDRFIPQTTYFFLNVIFFGSQLLQWKRKGHELYPSLHVQTFHHVHEQNQHIRVSQRNDVF